MDGFNIGKIIPGHNPDIYIKKAKPDGIKNGEQTFNSTFAQNRSASASQKNIDSLTLINQLQMNQLGSIDKSVYIKNLLGLPQTLGGILMSAQGKIPLTGNTLLMNGLNEDIIKNRTVLSQIINDNENFSADKLQNQINILGQQSVANKDAIALMFSGMIHLPAISEMILKNSKQAVAHLIAAMASASKNGMTSEQINETLGVINYCVSLAESGNPAQTLKSLMLLYLPWLPLNEDVGFDLEVNTDNGENDSIDSRLTVLIQTKNFGNVKGVFTLTTSNSVDVFITCSDNFPKTLLQKSLVEEGASHAMTTTVEVESIQPKKTDSNDKIEAKVNLSATNEMNPYLLLIAHAFIRNTIYIDSNAIIEDINETKTQN